MELQELVGHAVLMGAIVSLATTLIRKLAKRFGKEVTRPIVLIGVFVLAIAVSAATRYAPQDFVMEVSAIFSAAIVFYEVVVKTVALPALKKLGMLDA